MSPADVTTEIELEDNSLAAQVCGPHNGHLTRIERKLGVTINSRGNRLALSGEPDAVGSAVSVLNGLYDRLLKSLPVDKEEVDAAIRMVSQRGFTVADADTTIETHKRRISPRSPNQAAYLNAIDESDLVFGLGPAGTGKTYLAVAKAVERLIQGEVDRVILTRPAVEAGEHLGFLPGDMREKVDPYLRPLYDALHDMMPGVQVAKRMESDEIEVAPLAFMRGRTLSNAFVILDEAQNTTAVQMKMFLTRLGSSAQMVVTGDLSQVDLPRGTRSGLRDALETLRGLDAVRFVHFSQADVVRHSLVARIVEAYDNVERCRRAAAPYERSSGEQ